MAVVVGIDLGTTNTAFSFVENNEPKIIPNRDGYNITPTVLALGEDVLIGRAAKRQLQLHPKTTVHSSKRFIGRSYSEARSSLALVNYEVIENQQGECSFIIDEEEYTPQEIAATILRDLKQQMEEYLQDEILEAVITVPAYFDDQMRQATKDAGMLAGVDVLRIINEPTAAALAYSSSIQGRKKVVVYDFGGGTFDVSILEMESDFAHVQATRGDNALGGNDIDLALTNFICDQFLEDNDVDLRQDPISLQRIQDEAERVKCELSSVNSSNIYLPFIYSDIEKGALNLEMKITRDDLDELIEEFVQATIIECEKALKDAGLSPKQIDEVILVGGSSRIPLVQSKLKKLFPCRLNRSVNPEEVVALGAAMQADMLSGDGSQSVVLLDVTPFSLGIEEQGGYFKPLIHRNTSIPTEVKRQATTVVDNQRTIKLHILQGEDDIASENTSLGEFELTNIAPANRGIPKIDIRISIDSNGIVKVSATDTRSGRKEQITIERSKVLSPEARRRGERKMKEVANPVDVLRREIQEKLGDLIQFVDDHDSVIEEAYKKNIDELHRRSTVIIAKTEKMDILVKLLNSIAAIHNDLEDHIRPKIE